MKYILQLSAILLPVLFYSYSCQSGNNKNAAKVPGQDTAVISFNEYEHDFGRIAEGEKVACTFTFENTGKGVLVVTSVTTSCGCTVPKYETKPVSPGGKGTLEVIFDSYGRSGRQTKTITVNSNATKKVVLLRITGEVNSNSNSNN
jgi:hypothetical protein